MRNKSRLFLLFPGPKFNLEDDFKDRCEMLSERFRGVILTSGPSDREVVFGDFRVICVRDIFVNSLISTCKFIFWSFLILILGRLRRDPFELFVTYDPLKTGLIGVVVTKLTRTKLVVEVNGDYTQEVIYWEIKSPFMRRLKRRAMIFVEGLVLNHCSGVRLLFDDQIRSFMPLVRDPVIRRFPDYVNASGFSNMSEDNEILTVGFPFWVKGIDILIEAFTSVSDEFPDWRLKILGYYPDKTILNSHINGHPRISHHAPIDHTLMPEKIGHCGIFVLASRTEAMGRVLVEAMAAGKPRLGANVGGIPTVITDGVDGLLFKAGSAEDLAAKLKRLLSSKGLRSQLGEAARKRFERENQEQQFTAALFDFYMSVIQKK